MGEYVSDRASKLTDSILFTSASNCDRTTMADMVRLIEEATQKRTNGKDPRVMVL